MLQCRFSSTKPPLLPLLLFPRSIMHRRHPPPLKLLAAPDHFVEDRRHFSPYRGFTHVPAAGVRARRLKSLLPEASNNFANCVLLLGLLARILLLPRCRRALGASGTFPCFPTASAIILGARARDSNFQNLMSIYVARTLPLLLPAVLRQRLQSARGK